MDFKKIKKILIGSGIKVFLITLILFGFGLGMIITAFSDGFKGSVVALVIIGGLFGSLGLLVSFKVVPAIVSGITESHPLLKAIKNNQSDYVAWIFRKQINTTLRHGGSTVGKSNNICVYYKNGGNTELVLNRSTSPDDVLLYLSGCFPEAKSGILID